MHKKRLATRLCPGPWGAYGTPLDSLNGFRGGHFVVGREPGGMEGTEEERRDHPPTTNSWIRHYLLRAAAVKVHQMSFVFTKSLLGLTRLETQRLV